MKTSINKTGSFSNRSRNNKGFTLLEIGIVLAIIGIIAAILVPQVPEFLRSSRVKNTVQSYNTIKALVANSADKFGSSFPVTEGTVPVTGTALAGESATDVSNAARFDLVFVDLNLIEKLATFKMGNSKVTADGTGNDLRWDSKTRKFFMDDGTGAVSNTLTAARDWSAVSRVETKVSTPTTLPAAAQGGNFRLNGGTRNLPANTVVAYIVLKDVPVSDAIALSKTLNGDDLTTATEGGSANQENGVVVFAAPSGGATTVDVYMYLAHI